MYGKEDNEDREEAVVVLWRQNTTLHLTVLKTQARSGFHESRAGHGVAGTNVGKHGTSLLRPFAAGV